MEEGSGGAERGGFADDGDVEAGEVGGTGGFEPGLEVVGEVSGGEEDAGEAGAAEPEELDFEEGPSVDGDEGFGNAGKEGGYAGAQASEEEDGGDVGVGVHDGRILWEWGKVKREK